VNLFLVWLAVCGIQCTLVEEPWGIDGYFLMPYGCPGMAPAGWSKVTRFPW
jgi:hypothetical protein